MNEQHDSEVHTLLATLWLHRWWIVASIVAFSGVSIVLAFSMKPIYRAAVVMVSGSSERNSVSALGSALGQFGGLASLAGINVGGDSGTEEALAVLKSRQLTESFISERNLMPRLFAKKWNTAKGAWDVPAKDQPTPGDAYRYFDRKIREVSTDRKTGLITLLIDWSDRNEAADWANDLVRRINSEMRARAMAKSEASIGFLQKELGSTADVATREAINRLIESQIRQRMIASVTPEYAFRVIDRAMAPDAKDPVKPVKAMIVLFGFLLGAGIGCLGVLFMDSLKTAVKAV